ncbi:MAG TPA: FecR domain-containing protein [Polyangia bacterium]|jgi:hypothetical protein|nr:FecR domain-containing protein [Polyangia bacterium]
MKIPDESPRYARLAARVLARRADEDESAATGALPDRTASMAAIERALRARRRGRVTPWLGWGVVAAAAAVMLVIGWQRVHAPGDAGVAKSVVAGAGTTGTAGVTVAVVDGAGASIETPAGWRAAAAGDRIDAGASVRAPDNGRLLLALDTGTRLRLAAAARARVSGLGAVQRFDLQAGSLEADVAKLLPGSRFLIATADAEVEVRGTRFEVSIAPEPSACAPFGRTRVDVREGVVVVRSGGDEVRVTAGSNWPVCAPPAPPPVRATTHARRVRPATQPAADTQPAAPAAAPATDPSTLVEQNDLFAAALAARRRGDAKQAIHWLDRLIARYPDGPLIESARAERRRLIEAGGGSAPVE